MRRRLLLANSHAESGGGDLPSEGLPPESTSFGFPLYLNITKLATEYDDYIEYYREADDIGNALCDWLEEREPNDGGGSGLINIGDNEIYINGCRVTEVELAAYQDFIFYFKNSPFDEVLMSKMEKTLYGYLYK